MKINSSLILKIFNNEIKIKNKSDKIKISKFEEIIPMYDIYSQKIYPINNINVPSRLTDFHYRFITEEIKKWNENMLKKEKNKDIKKNIEYNLLIINNYDLETLEKTSNNIFFKYNQNLGMNISICKRKSFHKFLDVLDPYYSRKELLKLGLNNGILKKMDFKKILDKKTHYQICKKISQNDISRKEIKKFNDLIIKEKCISWLSYYSFIGSYIMNNFLRNNEAIINENLFNGLIKINNTIKKSPNLDNDYFFYRFISTDDFLRDIKTGDTFIDKGFLSTTRDPFYNPGLDQKFGMILLKIHLPKKLNGVGIFVENFSLFPKEEEFIIAPFTKLKLLSKDDDFKYFHINQDFEDNIKKKYEFEVVSTDFNKIKKLNYTDSEMSTISINSDYEGNDIISTVKNFEVDVNSLDNFMINIKNKNYIFDYQWFDSTDTYSKLYYNKIKDGVLFTHFDNGYPLLTIELGEEMSVNFIKKYYLYDDYKSLDMDVIIEIVGIFAKIFYYKNVKIFTNYRKFADLKKYKENEEYSDILHTKLYNNFLYDYCLNIDKDTVTKNKFLEYKYGYFKLNNFLKKNIPEEVNNYLPEELKNIKWYKLIIEIVEKHFYLYKNLESWLNKHGDNLVDQNYFIFDTIYYLNKKNINYNFPLNINYNKESKLSDNFKLIFRNNIKRII